jgi:hypothetical protein
VTQAELDRRNNYRAVFSAERGHRCLMDMLVHLHYFDEVVNQEELALRNYAVRLMNILGYTEPGNLLEGLKRQATLPVVDRVESHDDEEA